MEMFEWEMRVAAFQNSLYIAMCNRVGVEGEMRFAGDSLVIDPDGNLLVKGSCEEEMLYARLDRQLVQHSREARPYLRLRHPHLTATLKGFEEKNDARPPR
jgi:predicted amidohydrolase